MKKDVSYENELKDICIKLQKSINSKIGLISAIKINCCLKSILKLNNRTKNQNIEQLITVIGKAKLAYKRHCNENNISDPYVNKKIKEAYTKLSKKLMKINTKKKNIKNGRQPIMHIEYNSDIGKYHVNYVQNGVVVGDKDYKIKNVKYLQGKRNKVLDELTKFNYGISIFDELNIDKDKFYKVNPDIIHILLSEGKISYAKMYIKEVVGGEPINKPFEIKYLLNRNIKKGVFSAEENKNMKQMARRDRIANELVIFSDKRKKKIKQPEIKATSKLEIIESIKRSIKIQEAKEIIEKKRIIEKNEENERNMKIQAIMARKKISPNRSNFETVSQYGCKIYNIDRKNQNSDKTEEVYSNWRVYNIDSKNKNYNKNYNKNASGSEWSKSR